MRTKERNAWRGIALSLGLACLLGVLVYVTLTGLSTATADQGSDWPSLPPTLLNGADTYTTFLPVVLRNVCYSTRPPLKDTGHFAGEAEILTPADCTTGIPAESHLMAMGTYSGTPGSAILWVLAYAPNQYYYPQSPNACEREPPHQEGGTWQVPLYLGKKGGEPEWFDIVVILTDQAGSDFLGEWVRAGCLRREYDGLLAAQLEQYAVTEKGHISVQTAD
jgi:hypothetical protein